MIPSARRIAVQRDMINCSTEYPGAAEDMVVKQKLRTRRGAQA